MTFMLNDKKVLITGATAGIGLAVAKRFIGHDATVLITGRRDEGETSASQIGAHFFKADLSQENSVIELFDYAQQVIGPLDCVINNAGQIKPPALIAEQSMDDFDAVMGLNLRAAYQVMQQAAIRLPAGGSIINTASIAGLEGSAYGSVYNATKAAIISLTKTAALELAHKNIRVNAVSPGLIESEIWNGKPPNDYAQQRVPLGRVGSADEAAAVFQFLASDEAGYITGANYLVDGGYSAGSAMKI